MSRPPVEVVLINWKRPENLAHIVDALRSQTVPCTVTVCDCHPDEGYALAEATLAKVDRVYRWTHNLGAYSRYAPCAAYDHEYTYLADDDLLPGTRCLEHFLDHAATRPFGVLGQFGRRFEPDMIYRYDNVERTQRFEEVDMVVQAYFVRTRLLAHIATVRWELGQETTVQSEDDIMLAVAMQTKAGLHSFLTPNSDDPETAVGDGRLPSPHALSDRSDHLARRTALFDQSRQLGWRPVGSRQQTPAVWAVKRQVQVGGRRLKNWYRLRSRKGR